MITHIEINKNPHDVLYEMYNKGIGEVYLTTKSNYKEFDKSESQRIYVSLSTGNRLQIEKHYSKPVLARIYQYSQERKIMYINFRGCNFPIELFNIVNTEDNSMEYLRSFNDK